MRGKPIIVRCYGNIPRVVLYWSEDQYAIYITNDEEIKKLSNGDSSIFPIGFPREDVFKYDPNLAASMDDLWEKGKWDWDKLIPFNKGGSEK
jgi:hypothetical protein